MLERPPAGLQKYIKALNIRRSRSPFFRSGTSLWDKLKRYRLITRRNTFDLHLGTIMLRTSLVFAALLANFAVAEIGDVCTASGVQGTCQASSGCAGFTANGACPNDPADVKCCFVETCVDPSGSPGLCQNTASACDGTYVSNQCPGPNDVQCCVFGGGPSDDEPEPSSDFEIVFWINAFIPVDVEDVTQPWPNHPGKTVLTGLTEFLPAVGGCFLTDQRSFSSDIAASARMHSEVRLKVTDTTFDWTQTHRCDTTHKVDCDDGSEVDSATADTDDMAFSLIEGSTERVVLEYNGAASDPLVFLAPNVDMKGTLTVDRITRTVQFDGLVDDFPAFEAYVTKDGFGPYTIATLGPEGGALSLVGSPNREFRGFF